MSPMSLLTMPSEALRSAALNEDQASPQGERAEQHGTQYLLLSMVLVPLAIALMHGLGRW